MVTQVAVLSDIHGVLPALEAVLAEPAVQAADEIILTGDIAAGPQPVATLDLLTSLGARATWVRGNADRELVEFARGATRRAPDRVSPWAAKQLRADQVALLAALPTAVERVLPGLGRTVFCHATPRDDEEVVLVDSALDRWAEVFGTLDEGVKTVVCGHSHMPFLRLAHGRTVINPGSVGMPYGGAGAHWALLGGDCRVSLRRTALDLDAVCARIAAESGYPRAAEFADTYVRSRFSDADAITAFGPRDGRGAGQTPE
ncbi:metallophosphoesterase family protein [Natronosporangium hydrolyticum]|uniref:Metallophosphoesterase family protein n=1 Tax=Natronosporangium hydrolyticum TaxID=2811111 RepID=A0A895YM28_9ACTN|nr:metallophosphoesterase family protein [Natronosporangium hydrolyticum]QSB14938.1 metallophosphoesterase family protein [Natronosporangium hydrolyticum]